MILAAAESILCGCLEKWGSMKEEMLIAAIVPSLLLAGCSQSVQAPQTQIAAPAGTYQQISQQEAKQMMDELEDARILDVRELSEYNEVHIPGAELLPLGTITEESAAKVIPAKDTVVLVYCRSGNRSKKASQALADLGYTNIYEFGGINEWPYEKE